MRWITPREAGAWQAFGLILSYLSVLQLGIFSGLGREFPFLMGAGMAKHAMQLARAANAYALLISIVTLVILIVIGFFTPLKMIGGPLAIFCLSGGAAALVYQQFLSVTYLTSIEFDRLSLIYALNSILLLVTIILVFRGGFAGFCIRYLLLGSVLVALMYSWRPFREVPCWDASSLRHLFKTGVIISGFTYLSTVSLGFCRLTILEKGGISALGYFAPGFAMYGGVSMLGSSMNTYLSPKFSTEYGASGNARKLWRKSLLGIVAIFAIQSVLAVSGWLIMPTLFRWLLPHYMPGMHAAQLMLLAGIFSAVNASTSVLVSIKAWWHLGLLMAGALLSRWLFPVWAASTGHVLEGVATGWILADGTIFLLGIGVIYHALHRK